MSFSANLGFLWTDLALPDAIRAAKRAGFDAVECHWPYATPPAEVAEALAETGLPMLGLNTARGDVAAGENGLAAIPGREADARAAIDEAIAYARAIAARNIHVMGGYARGAKAQKTYVANLTYACERAVNHGLTILVEPLNRHDAPGYIIETTTEASAIIDEVGAPNLKLIFDCYHVGRSEGDLCTRMARLMPRIGHIQFAAVPDRGPPDTGELAFDHLFRHIRALGYDTPLGAEYKPAGATEDSLGWMATLRAAAT